MRFLWRETSLKSISKCHRVRFRKTVTVWGDGEGQVGYGGFCRCHSVWACPLCAPAIRRARAAELSGGLVRHLAGGGGCVFVTSTIPHDQGDGLVPLFNGVAKGWADQRADVKVRQWFGDHHVEWVRAAEVTYGANGWHPHLHSALVTDRPLERAEAVELRSILYEPWCRSVERSGWRRPSEKYGLTVIRCGSGDVGDYLSKVEGLADELTRLDSKRPAGKTVPPFTLLRQAAGGDPQAIAVWHEYERGTKGRRALVRSRGLRDRLALGAELPDSDLSEPSEDSWRVLGELSPSQADLLVRHPEGFEVFAELVGDGTPEAIEAALTTLRGTMPRWLKEHSWWLHGDQGQADEEAWWRSGAAIPLSLFDTFEVRQ